MQSFSRTAVYLSWTCFLLLTIGACKPSPEGRTNAAESGTEFSLTFAGSTFAAPIFQRWLEVYGDSNPALQLNYAAVGSGEGIARFLAGTADVGVTDAPLNSAEAAAIEGGVLQIPITAGMIAITYNLPGVEGPLNLPRDVYVDIFLGNLSRWDDPRLANANPGINFPHKLIQTVARLDSSGTTFAFTNHLAAISEKWANGPGVGKVIDWPGGAMVARGNEGVAQRIKVTEGSIGYVEAGFAERLGLPLSWLENAAGGFVAPNVETGQRGLTGGSDSIPKDLILIIPDPEGARSYPIVTYVWVLLRGRYADPDGRAALMDLINWMLAAGQGYAEPLGYVPLPDNVVRASLAKLSPTGG
jgi:phosphate transport system substrate-binding protein